MTLYEMEGFLRGKCLPGDMMVNESNAQYLVRKFSELQSQNAELAEQLANAESKCRELAAENAEMRSSIDATIGWQESTDPENGESVRMLVDIKTPATDAFLAEVRAHDLNAFIRHHSAELDAHIKNGGEQFDEKSVRIRDIIVSARLFREQIRKEAAQ
ncbi:MAG: hNH endonuclease [Citrobacter freundii]|nr:hNH endonuclease [Citrobacter freundii]MDU4808391.1 hNH endonuclease [Citrobacter freundii]